MSTVVISAPNVVGFPEGGGHLWVFLQYVRALQALGCEVYWLERFRSSGDAELDTRALSTFRERMGRFGLADRLLLHTREDGAEGRSYLGVPARDAEATLRRADLLLNFHYEIDPSLLALFRRTALVDIDPGLLQFWIGTGQIELPAHDTYFTIGETVGHSDRFPDCGLAWQRIRPPVFLEEWPFVFDAGSEAFTTVSGWWGGGSEGEWITDGQDLVYENNKRVTFLQLADLARHTSQPLELALCMGDGDLEDAAPRDKRWQPRKPCPRDVTDYRGDAEDRAVLERAGWRVRRAQEVAGSPEAYRAYIQASRGEFSCVKPSCIAFQNAWVSDRTICYLASGKPAIVQHTGPSDFLPNGEGLFRFCTAEEALVAIELVNADYAKHCRAARELAETRFEAKGILEQLLNAAG